MELLIYITIAFIIVITTIILSINSYSKRNKIGRALGGTLAAAASTAMFYLCSIVVADEMLFSIMSTFYFVSVDVMVLFLLIYSFWFTENKLSKKNNTVILAAHILIISDIILLIINIFTNISISYKPEPDLLLGYSYQMHSGYYIHLVIDYLIICVAIYRFVRKMLSLPWEYKRPYIAVISGILVVVIINALWLFVPQSHIWIDLDYSIWGFSIAGYFMYWTSFKYIPVNMSNNFRNEIVEAVEQGVVLFAIDGTRIVTNSCAEKLLPAECLAPEVELEQFTKICGIDIKEYDNIKTFSTQIVLGEGEQAKPLRCDCHIMENKKHQTLGRLFVFSDTIRGVDLLTGFHTLENFDRIAGERKELFVNGATVVIIDLIGLKLINSNQGRTAGDAKIRQLAREMKLVFPRDTFYVRGQDANLMAICRNIDEKKAKEYVNEVDERFDGAIQYAIGTHNSGQPMSNTIAGVERTLRARKLMDKQSHHSEVLTSLLVALQECDSDTEKHVERTQQMGAEIGKRIGLQEVELSDLSLLCILHDIGKIGIPLEILNKPGKLTEAEWVIMKSHVEKGYQITASNQELAPIANMVRAHHERWDGRGYPDGLKGHDIPKLSRIISIVDSYDAMVNDRIYRPAMAPSDAQAEILKCAGTQFDPFIAQEFVKMLQEPEFQAMSNAMAEKVAKRKEVSKRSKDELDVKLKAAGSDTSLSVIDFGHCTMKMDGRIIKANDSFLKALGYTEYDLDNNEIYLSNLILDKDFRSYVDMVSKNVRSGGLSVFWLNLRCKSGEEKKAMCAAKLFYDTGSHDQLGEFIIINVSELI